MPMKPPGATITSVGSGSSQGGSGNSASKSDKVSLLLRSARNPKLDVRLLEQDLGSSILDLKTAVVKQMGEDSVQTNSVKILYKKKPCGDSKTVKEVLGDEELDSLRGKEAEFGIMVMGYKPKPSEDGQGTSSSSGEKMEGVESSSMPVAQGSSGEMELTTEEFWDDLRGFLTQRLRDEDIAGEVFDRFREAWTRRAKT